MTIAISLQTLKARLPELEWQMNKPGISITPSSLPKGVFRYTFEPSSSFYINEIKTDIERLAQHSNETAARYLASRIEQKINLLVRICYCQSRGKKPEWELSFNLESLSTRQQRLQTLEANILILRQQRDALKETLALKSSDHNQIRLALIAELGSAEKKLCEAQEFYAKSLG